MFLRVSFFCLFAALAASSVSAQIGGPGLRWAGSSGTFAGSFSPDCTNYPVVATRGETVTITVWGDRMSPYGLMLSPVVGRCATIPGFDGGLLLGPPLVPLVTGTLTQYSPCLACPESFEDIVVTIPSSTMIGLSVSLQAVGFGWGRLALTGAITATVM